MNRRTEFPVIQPNERGGRKVSGNASFCSGQFVAGDLFGVTHVKITVGDRRMVPRLAVDRLEAAKLFVPVWASGYQNGLAILGNNDQNSLIDEQEHLPVPVATRLPAAFSGCRIDTAEKALVEPVYEAA